MDEHEWKKIQPVMVHYARRDIRTSSTHQKYRSLPKFKWATFLREKLWELSKLPCTWNFKNKKVDGENNISLFGKCSQCQRETIIKTEAISEKTVRFTCDILTCKEENVPHNPKKKSKLTPYKRGKLAKILQYKPAVVVQKELAAKLIKDPNQVCPPVLPSLAALRQIKYEKRQSKRLHAHPILSILMMTQEVQNFIREVTLIPCFHLYYWSDQQIEYYTNYCNSFSKVTITVDATGSFFQAIKLPDGTTLTKRLFVYIGMIASDSIKSTPIFQMVTDSHNKDSIAAWLKKWLIQVRSPPHEIITDDSSALIAANVSAFTTFSSIKDYVKRSVLVLSGRNYALPEVFIRLDTSHFIKTIYNLRCFENRDINVKMLYVRCILYMKECESFQQIKTLITDVVRLCLTEYDNPENPVSVYIQKISCTLGNTTYTEPNEDTDEKENIHENIILDDDDGLLSWFDEIVEREKSLDKTKSSSESQNSFYMPHLITTLKRLLLKLPLWSNIMCPLYKSQNKVPTSSAIESYFKTMKNLLFTTRSKKYNIDEYLNMHYDYLLGEIKIALNCLNNFADIVDKKEKNIKRKRGKTRKRKMLPFENKCCKKEKPSVTKTFLNDSVFSVIPTYVENWRGEGVPKDDSANKPVNIMFLKNSNFTVQDISEKNIKLTNTCAFDSVFFLLAHGFKEYSCIRDLFDNNCRNRDITAFLQILCNSDNNSEEANKLRIRIASIHFKNNHYDCECNAAFIYEHVLNDIIFSASSVSNCSNSACINSTPSRRKHVFIPLNLDIINIFTISNLEDSIIIHDWENKQCRKCNEVVLFHYTLSKIVTFDLNGTQMVFLHEVPKSIIIKQNIYKLLGAVEYVPPILGTIGHYKCHIIRNSGMLCYDDNKSKLEESTNDSVYIHFLTYVLVEV